MITLFTTPRAFTGQYAAIQRNALQSWRTLGAVEVLLVGDDAGTAEAAAELGLVHVPEVERNEFGTPLVSSIFELAQLHASHDRLCYVNADIILFPDFVAAVAAVERWNTDAVVTGRRCDVPVPEEIELTSEWRDELRRRAAAVGVLGDHTALDFFVFRRGVYDAVPPFALGRTTFDNWLAWYPLDRGLPVVDASTSVLALHQHHDYTHVEGGQAEVFGGVEATRNRSLLGGTSHFGTVFRASHVLGSDLRVRRASGLRYRRERAHYRIVAARERLLGGAFPGPAGGEQLAQ